MAPGRRLVLRLALWLLAVVIVALNAPAASAGCTPPADAQREIATVISGTNALRRQKGLQGLVVNDRLSAAAQSFACELARTQNFSHTGAGGSTIVTRTKAKGYNGCWLAENLLWGWGDPDKVVSGWRGSPGHYSNMVHPKMREVGVGLAYAGKRPYWVMDFGASC